MNVSNGMETTSFISQLTVIRYPYRKDSEDALRYGIHDRVFGNRFADHVGIVEKVEDGFVYTIEGNSGDRCSKCCYTIGSPPILGYGLPNY